MCVCVCVCAREGGRLEGTTAERGFGVGREDGICHSFFHHWQCLSTTWSEKPLHAEPVS